jgi:hypothetical protein
MYELSSKDVFEVSGGKYDMCGNPPSIKIMPFSTCFLDVPSNSSINCQIAFDQGTAMVYDNTNVPKLVDVLSPHDGFAISVGAGEPSRSFLITCLTSGSECMFTFQRG